MLFQVSPSSHQRAASCCRHTGLVLDHKKKIVFSTPCCFLSLSLHLWPYLAHALAPCCDKMLKKGESGKHTSLAAPTSDSLLL